MKRKTLIPAFAAIACLAWINPVAASEKEDAASLERLRGEIARRLPAGWAVTIDPARRGPGRGPGAEKLALVIASKEKLPIETHAPNPPAGKSWPSSMSQVEIVLTVLPFMTAEQYESARAKDRRLTQSLITLQKKLQKQMRWGFMGGDPIPPSAFNPANDRERRLLLEYSLLWSRSEFQALPTHYYETESFDLMLSQITVITDKAKAKEYDQIVKMLDELLAPYEKSER